MDGRSPPTPFSFALTGARYDAVEKVLYLAPKVKGDWRAFLCTATGYGTVGIKDGRLFLEVSAGGDSNGPDFPRDRRLRKHSLGDGALDLARRPVFRPRHAAPSWVEVDLAAVRHNVRAILALLAGGAKGMPTPSLIAVVKADAYGHGAIPVGRAAVEAGAAMLAVASPAEGAELREAGLAQPILVLGAGDPSQAESLVRLDLAQTLCAKEMARALSEAARRLERPARVHVKIDSGLGRLGLRPEQAADFAAHIRGLPGLQFDGVFSHLATGEDPHPGYAQLQLVAFHQAVSALREGGCLRHRAISPLARRSSASPRCGSTRSGPVCWFTVCFPTHLFPLFPTCGQPSRGRRGSPTRAPYPAAAQYPTRART